MNHHNNSISIWAKRPFLIPPSSLLEPSLLRSLCYMVISSVQHDPASQFGSLLLVVFNSILEVFILCLAGYLLAHRGILDKKTQKHLNRLNVSLFTPALLFSKVAFFLTPQKLRELWVIPIFFVIVTTASGLIAFILGWMFQLKRSQRSFAVAAAMFMNSNSLPIALMQSLVVTVPDLRWDAQDNVDAMLGRALTYLVLYSTLGMIVRWSYGVKLLSQADPETTEAEVEETTPLLGGSDNGSDSHSGSTCEFEGRDISRLGIPQGVPYHTPPRGHTNFFNSFPNSPNLSRSNLSPYGPIYDGDDGVPSGFNHRSEAGLLGRVMRSVLHVLKTVRDFMTVPLWAALASIAVAFIPPLQNWLQNSAQPLNGAITSAGNCSIPLTLVVLGAYFYPEVPESSNTESNSPSMFRTSPSTSTLVGELTVESSNSHPRKAAARKGETTTVIVSIMSRMILTPLVLMPLIVFAAKYDFHAVLEDPVFVVTNVLLLASPPAVTLAQITQAASGDAFERLISRTIFWSYCVFTPPTVILFVFLGLVLSKI